MSRNGRAAALILNVLLLGMGPQAAWGQQARWAAQAIVELSDVSPAIHRRDLTEGYLTQPVFAGMLTHGPLSFQGTLNFEGLTLKRGELNAGIWGEGYIDRRHPHTYLHEAMATARQAAGGVSGSISAGRGFAPFGSDDPMVRYFVKYPVNHHLSQILERWVLMAGLRAGPVTVEAGTFNGDEPAGPRSMGQIDRFGDSFSGRITITPLPWLELAASAARVESPELVTGGGLDQRKRHGSIRLNRKLVDTEVYALAEYARTADVRRGAEVFVFTSALAEVMLAHNGWRIGARYEDTVRPEEERLANPFRSVRPPTDFSILGRTRFRTGSLQLAYTIDAHGARLEPFVELQRGRAAAEEKPALIEPAELYGRSTINTLSLGVRFSAGRPHQRMGRYGVALEQSMHEH